jgi:uncharacterized protein YecE (DUF72 family)
VIRVGPAGWQYKDWQGVVYPKPKPRGFSELAFLARFFDTVEINTSFYGPPRPESVRAWVDKVSDNRRFRFTAKLYKAFTHDRNATAKDEQDMKAALDALMAADRLGALLLQFAWSFRHTPENWTYLASVFSRFCAYPLVLEVRHASWTGDAVREALAERGVGFCNIDQPLFSKSVKPSAHATSPVGYVRLHGRNYKQWFSDKADVRERYDYLYSPQELDPWIERIKTVAAQAQDSYVVTNNHNLGKAVLNARDIEVLLGMRPPELPR